jgi:hypothetical protein
VVVFEKSIENSEMGSKCGGLMKVVESSEKFENGVVFRKVVREF